MGRVLECIEWDNAESVCVSQAWVEHQSFQDSLPTIEQATVVGNVMLVAVMSVCAAGLLIRKGKDDED